MPRKSSPPQRESCAVCSAPFPPLSKTPTTTRRYTLLLTPRQLPRRVCGACAEREGHAALHPPRALARLCGNLASMNAPLPGARILDSVRRGAAARLRIAHGLAAPAFESLQEVCDFTWFLVAEHPLRYEAAANLGLDELHDVRDLGQRMGTGVFAEVADACDRLTVGLRAMADKTCDKLELYLLNNAGKDLMNAETIELLCAYIDLENFNPATAKSASQAAEGLLGLPLPFVCCALSFKVTARVI